MANAAPSDEAKKVRKQQLKDAELRQELAAAEEAEVNLRRSQIELQSAEDNYDVLKVQPDHTGKFVLSSSVEDSPEVGMTPMATLRWRLLSYAERHPEGDIELTINSLGGDAHIGMLLYNTLRQLSANGHHVTTIIGGWAASMAGVIFQAGDTRIMGPEALLMIHEPHLGMVGNASDFREQGEFLESLTMQFAMIFARRSTLTADQIRENFKKKDWWIFPSQALELGFADEVIGGVRFD